MRYLNCSGLTATFFTIKKAVLLATSVALLMPIACAQVTVTISPTSASVATNATQVLTATVTGASNTDVIWQVNGNTGGTSAAGVISTTVPGTSDEALYLAPAAVPSGSVTVTAVSQADSTKSASATLTIQLPSRSGVTYYVSTTGNDANPGTSTAPFRTIQHAANTVHPGDTVQVAGGVYNEIVTIPTSGNATQGYITFTSAPGQTAIVDGTNLGVTGQQGLFSLEGAHSYIVIQGFEIRNYSSATSGLVPVGIDFEGSGSNIELLNNHIHNIVQSLKTCNAANALGIAIYGTQAPASINNITLSGNELDHNTTGCSENVSFDGNVQYFVETKNLVHDNDNIGLDDIGFEGVSPNVSYDQARDGWVFQNTIYNITSSTNPVYKGSLGANGYYCDGCTRVIVERNLIHDADIPIEMASEHSGHVSSYDVARNNVIYHALLVGISIGGYASRVGGSDHITIVNNSLWADDTHNTSSGELQIQYNATNNTIENNIMYASTQGLLINDFTSSSPNPATLDHNLYYTTLGAAASKWTWQKSSITGFANYQAQSGQDVHSTFADPQYLNISNTPPNLDISATSPAVGAGVNLGPSVVGILDYNGNARLQSGKINLGAYEQ
jgi:hypothetical protein